MNKISIHLFCILISTQKIFHSQLIDPSQKEPLLKLEQVKKLFPDSLFNIIELNSNLLVKIEERVENWTPWQKLGDTLLKIGGLVEVYTQYVKEYDSAISIFQEQKTKPKFAQFLWVIFKNKKFRPKSFEPKYILKLGL